MHWSIDDAAGRLFLRVTTHGAYTAEDNQRMVEDVLAHPAWRPGRPILFDHRDLDMRAANLDAMTHASGVHADATDRIGNAPSALLMGSAADFGVARQFEMLVASRADTPIRVFRDEAEAVAWLEEGPP